MKKYLLLSLVCGLLSMNTYASNISPINSNISLTPSSSQENGAPSQAAQSQQQAKKPKKTGVRKRPR